MITTPASRESELAGLPFWASPNFFLVASITSVYFFEWARKWLVSGAPILTWVFILGASKGYRVLSVVPLWTLISTLNLFYAISATSWLLYWVFAVACYPGILLSCMFQFDLVAGLVRSRIRKLLKELHFVDDAIALFNIPALEIDTEVDGLMVIRGITLSMSSLTLVAHGVEVGIKLTDDMELAIQVDKVTVRFFRDIEIGDVFANVKGGEYEMTFHDLAPNTHDDDGDALMVTDTALLRVATATGDTSRPKLVKMVSKMTMGDEPKDGSAKDAVNVMTQMSADGNAKKAYKDMLQWIETSSLIAQGQAELEKLEGPDECVDVRAAICSQLQDKPTIPHPPHTSIKVTTLQNLSPPARRRFLHRLPMLLRLLLNPLAYFHPIKIASISSAGSGKWIASLLQDKLFRDYADDNAELRRLQRRILQWLLDARFVIQLASVEASAQVPFLPKYDINCKLKIDDVKVTRTLVEQTSIKEVIRIGGADATVSLPAFLLPHHEHLLPPMPTKDDVEDQEAKITDADRPPKTFQAKKQLEKTVKDETSMKISAHARLPACFDQELLNFIAALVKASKVIEMEKDPRPLDQDLHGFKEYRKAMSTTMKDSFKRTTVDALISDKWIAKMVGKITKKLETAQGDIGYSGDVPIPLEPYRLKAEPDSKLLP